MIGPAGFVVIAYVAGWGAAALLMALGILTAVVIRRTKAPGNETADMEEGVGTNGQRAQEIQHLDWSRVGR